MSTILFYESNRLSLWHSGAAPTRAHAPLGESDERDQATPLPASERDESDLTTWNAVANFSYAFAPFARAAWSGTKKRIEMPGARHMCVCLEGGAQQFKERLKRRETQEEVKRRGGRESSEGANKGSRCYGGGVLFIYSFITPSEERLSSLQTEEKRHARVRLRQGGCRNTVHAHTHLQTDGLEFVYRRKAHSERERCATRSSFINI